jgi:phospholipid/cholesterol/gamma-HCH transport system ATP-binding protein
LPAIELADVHKAFGGKPVLAGLSLEVARGERLSVLGRSGSGKTVLLKHIVGLLKPDRGTVRVAGVDVAAAGPRRLRDVRSRIGYLFQGAALLNSLTVFDNVALPLRETPGVEEGQVRHQVLDRLRMVGLEGAARKYPSELSGGMRKRAGLARAIVGRREIFLLDEPTTGLDPAGVTAIADLILDLHGRLGATTVVVTHDVGLALRLSTRLAILHEGRTHVSGTPEDLRGRDDPIVREFLGGAGRAA